MKIIKIFGAVLALHGLAFLLIFANPGCSSTKRPPVVASTPAVPALETAAMINLSALPVAAIPGPTADVAALGFDPDAPAISGAERYAPRRPNPDAAVTSPTPMVEEPPAKTYTVVGGDSLWTIAKRNEVTVSELSRANNLAANAMIRPGQKLVIPGKNTPATKETAAAASASYRVKSNETLAGIARRAGVPAATLRELNALKTDELRVGQELKLPPGVTVAPPAPAQKQAENAFTHVVQPGETLETIARKYGLRTGELGVANNIANPALIRAGATLVIPGMQAATKTAEPAAAPAAPVLQIPGPGQDLNAGLKSAPTALPAIRIENAIPILPAK
jgi:LysM repeat protein